MKPSGHPDRLGIGMLSVLGLHPIELVAVAPVEKPNAAG